MDKLQGLLKDIGDKFTDEESLMDQYSRDFGGNPLDIILEKECRQRIVLALPLILEAMDSIDKEILELYIVDGWTMEAIGCKLGLAVSRISERLSKIPTKVQKIFPKIAEKIPYIEYRIGAVEYNDFFSDYFDIPDKAGHLTSLGYPSDLLKAVSAGGYWGQAQFKRIYKSKTQCLIKDYLAASFKDDLTACPSCAKQCGKATA